MKTRYHVHTEETYDWENQLEYKEEFYRAVYVKAREYVSSSIKPDSFVESVPLFDLDNDTFEAYAERHQVNQIHVIDRSVPEDLRYLTYDILIQSPEVHQVMSELEDCDMEPGSFCRSVILRYNLADQMAMPYIDMDGILYRDYEVDFLG